MNRILEKNNSNKNNVLLEIFDIQDKCMELEALIIEKGYNIFQGANVVITVPTLDESHHYIRKDDSNLFDKQRKDALDLAMYLTDNNANFIEIIKDINIELDDYLDRIGERLNGGKIDYLICLHEHTDIEKDFIVQTLNKETTSHLTTIELY